MVKYIVARMFLSSAASALAIGLASSAIAQTAPNAVTPSVPATALIGSAEAADTHSGLEDIVVTARRVSENLQAVPISVGTLNAQALASRQILNVNDLKGSVAGLTTSRTATPGGGYVTIRGITPLSLPTPSADSSVGFYIDGVYIARGQGSGVDTTDLSQVEVLRGPQGTLFGRNSSAGAINFITTAPTDRLEAKFKLLYGNYGHFTGSAIINVPITDTLIFRGSYQHNQEDGDVRNTTTSKGYIYNGYGSTTPAKTLGATNSESVSAKLRFTGIAGLTVDYKYDYENYVESSGASQVIGYLPGPFASTLASILPFQAPGAVVQSFTRLGAINEDFQGNSPIVNSGHLLSAAYEINDSLTVKNISAWRKTRSDAFSDLDGADWRIPLAPTFTSFTPFCVSCNRNSLRQSQFSQENQVIGKFDKLNFILGSYYFVEHSRFTSLYSTGAVIPQAPAVYTPPTDAFVNGAPGPLTLGEDGIYVNRSLAAYAHGDYAFTNQLKLAAGIRYTEDRRFEQDLRPFSPGTGKVSYGRFTYDAALNFQATQDQLYYAKYSVGYLSGGIAAGLPFRPETNRQAELGFKTELLDRRLRLNGSAFYSWIKDRQNAAPSVNPLDNPVLEAAGFSAPFPLGIAVYNQEGITRIWGFELEASVVPVDGLTVTGNFGYNHPKPTDGTFNRAPKTTFSFSGQYDFHHFENDSYFSVRIDGDYRGPYYGTGANTDAVFVGDIPAALRPGYATSADYLAAVKQASIAGDYSQVNGRVSLVDFPISDSKARLSGFVRNIFNNQGLLFSVNYGFSVNGSFERPRTYGLELSLDF
jgi:iron complex outermembrane receptor protein